MRALAIVEQIGDQSPFRFGRYRHNASHNVLIVKELLKCERSGAETAPLNHSRCSGGTAGSKGGRFESHNYRFSRYGPKTGFTQAGNLGLNLVSRPKIHQKNMVMSVMDHLIQGSKKFGMTNLIQPALENGQLDPFTVALQEIEDASPAFLVANVVGHYEESFLHLGLAGDEPGYLIELTQKVAPKQACLQFQQAPVTQAVAK